MIHRRSWPLAAVILALAGCGASSTASTGNHWSDTDAQSFMATCEQSAVSINYDCLCLQTTMQSDGRSPDGNPGDLPKADLAGCKN